MTDHPVASPGEAVGILGGGQLGRMLALAAARMGLDTVVLDPDPDAPAARVAGKGIAASYEDHDALRALARAVRFATYEFENVPVGSVERLQRDGVVVRPGAEALRVAQDRKAEKAFLESLEIPVAPWLPVGSGQEAEAALRSLGAPAILKTRRMGYDGRGQRRIGPDECPRRAFDSLGRAPAVLERQVQFSLEFSVVGVRGADGGEIVFDASRNWHEEGILRWSRVPAGIPEFAEESARMAVGRTQRALGYVGAAAIEFFLLADGSIMANEIAPRVHNSGHWTTDACDLDQFEAHMRAVAGWPVHQPRRHSSAEMRNLLGEEADGWLGLAVQPGLRLHLYGKRQARAGRKMGHATKLGVEEQA